MTARFRTFPLDRSQVAASICNEYVQTGVTGWEYVPLRHRFAADGISLDGPTVRQLRQFTNAYATFMGAPDDYYRLDLYITPDSLAVLEVNADFVDGWGTALNIARAAGIETTVASRHFPSCFVLANYAYRPELELLLAELGGTRHHICAQPKPTCSDPLYLYGRALPPQHAHRSRYGSSAYDDKHRLAEFATSWSGDLVRIPQIYTSASTAWGDIPNDAFLKFAQKSGPQSEAARFSVRYGKPLGKAKFLQACWRDGSLIAQANVDGLGRYGQPAVGVLNPCAQLVVLAHRGHLAGYVQYDVRRIITDDSVHAPLYFA